MQYNRRVVFSIFRRSATCTATTDVTIWKVHQKTFRLMMASGAKKKEDGILNILRKVPFMKDLEQGQLTTISEALLPMTIEAGKRLFSKGDVGNVFYIVEEGTLKVENIGKGLSQFMTLKLRPGEFFGERSVMTGERRIADVTAVTDCRLLCLSKEIFSSVLGDFEKCLFEETKKKLLLTIPIFSSASVAPRDISKFVKLFEVKTYEKDSYLAKEGEPIGNPGLYYIKEGHVQVSTKDGVILDFSKGEHFGGRTIQMSESNEKQFFDVTARIVERTTCFVLSKEAIESVVGSVSALGDERQYSKELPKITPHDLIITRELGQGSFGKVFLVYHEETGEHYAMKTISKSKLIELECSQAVLRERNIMASSHHPFVVKIMSTFQDDAKLYMILELVRGGELFDVIYEDGGSVVPGVSRKDAQFYGACVHEGLSHIHSHQIAFRDLKPENVLVDERGYCILIDFGFAKVVVDKTFTMCGTPEYVAPEIILSRGHNTAVDNWALGVLIFELMAGYTPFHEDGISERKMFRRILKGKFDFPDDDDDEFSDASKDIVTKLLNTNPSQRLGSCGEGEFGISGHDFFKEIVWKELLEKKIEAPWLPEIDDVLEDTPLTNVVEDDEEDFDRRLTMEENELFRSFGSSVGKVSIFEPTFHEKLIIQRENTQSIIEENDEENSFKMVEDFDLDEENCVKMVEDFDVPDVPVSQTKNMPSPENEFFRTNGNGRANNSSSKTIETPAGVKISQSEEEPSPTSVEKLNSMSQAFQDKQEIVFDEDSERERKSFMKVVLKKARRCACMW